MLDEREALLRAVFDNPDDDTPRLVYADWLDDHGEAAFAELIRLQCGDPAHTTDPRFAELLTLVYPPAPVVNGFELSLDEWPTRGFLVAKAILTTAEELLEPLAFRTRAAERHPEWFGATRLEVTGGLIQGGAAFETLFNTPATQKVTELDLRGQEVMLPGDGNEVGAETGYGLSAEYEHRPVVTVLGVEALARHRAARRLTALDLRNNQLDNDAARLLVRSPYLTRLARLDILDGNNLRGDTWAQLLERFGKDVVT
jgi:uncharacterized protein (TIGR02996 family)